MGGQGDKVNLHFLELVGFGEIVEGDECGDAVGVLGEGDRLDVDVQALAVGAVELETFPLADLGPGARDGGEPAGHNKLAVGPERA
jgi:hypothetical protein